MPARTFRRSVTSPVVEPEVVERHVDLVSGTVDVPGRRCPARSIGRGVAVQFEAVIASNTLNRAVSDVVEREKVSW